MPWRLQTVVALPGYRLSVCFIAGLSGIVDMSALVASPSAGVFAALRHAAAFERVYVENGVVTWPGELDLAPDAMHAAIKQRGEWVLA